MKKRTGKLLFPHLERSQRKHQMLIIMLVLANGLSAAGLLVMRMTSGWPGRIQIGDSQPIIFMADATGRRWVIS